MIALTAAPGAPGDVELRDAPEPQCSAGQTLVRILESDAADDEPPGRLIVLPDRRR